MKTTCSIESWILHNYNNNFVTRLHSNNTHAHSWPCPHTATPRIRLWFRTIDLWSFRHQTSLGCLCIQNVKQNERDCLCSHPMRLGPTQCDWSIPFNCNGVFDVKYAVSEVKLIGGILMHVAYTAHVLEHRHCIWCWIGSVAPIARSDGVNMICVWIAMTCVRYRSSCLNSACIAIMLIVTIKAHALTHHCITPTGIFSFVMQANHL